MVTRQVNVEVKSDLLLLYCLKMLFWVETTCSLLLTLSQSKFVGSWLTLTSITEYLTDNVHHCQDLLVSLDYL